MDSHSNVNINPLSIFKAGGKCKKHDPRHNPHMADKAECSSHDECCSKNCLALETRYCDPKTAICVDDEEEAKKKYSKYCSKERTDSMRDMVSIHG